MSALVLHDRLKDRETYGETKKGDVHLSTGQSVQLLVEPKTTGKVTHTQDE